MAKLDDAGWHYGGNAFPAGVPDENGGTHIGMFATWAIRSGIWGDFLGPNASAAVEAVRVGHIAGRQFLFEHCDGKLLSEMFTPEGARFAEDYYPRKYLRDFQRTLAKGLSSDYLVEDTKENYEKIAEVINQRHKAWKEKPWWKFWS